MKLVREYLKLNIRENLNILKGPSEEDALKATERMSPNDILVKGAQFGSLMLIKLAIEKGADIQYNNDHALRAAASGGYLDIVKYLIEQGADIHADNDCALRITSAFHGHLDVVKYLVEQGADIHAHNNFSLRWAAFHGHLDVVKYLVQNGADIYDETGDQNSALALALKSGNSDVANYIKHQMGLKESLNILKGPSEEDALKAFENTKPNKILLKGAEFGSLMLVKIALERGADIHYDKDNALRWAAHGGHLDIVKYLVEQGADIHAQKDFALRSVANNGYLDIVKYLIEQGANVNAGDDYALQWAAAEGHLDVVKYLVEKGANIHAINDLALRLAKDSNHSDVVNYLKNELKEGVGDKYAEKFGVVNKEKEFEKKFQQHKSSEKGDIVGYVKGKPIIKNPKDIKSFPPGARGVIKTNGDLYVATDLEDTIHNDILTELAAKGIIDKTKTRGWEDPNDIKKFGFITVQRVWNKAFFAIGESYMIPKPSNEDERKEVLLLFKPFFEAAKSKNPNIEFTYGKPRWAAKNLLSQDELEQFKKSGS